MLREAGLVREERHGRERIYRVEPAGLRPVADWLSPYEAFWRGALRDLHQRLDAGGTR